MAQDSTTSDEVGKHMRIVEWVLASIGAGICIGVSSVFWQQQSAMLAPGDSLWPLPGAILLEIAVLGLIGLIGIVPEYDGGLLWRGHLTWAAIGGLFPVMLLGVFSVGLFVIPAIVAFGIAAVLADRRRGRNVVARLGLAAVIAILNGVLLLVLIAAAYR